MPRQLMDIFPEMSPQDFNAYSLEINAGTSFVRTPVPEAVGIAGTPAPRPATGLVPAFFRSSDSFDYVMPEFNKGSLVATQVKPAAETGIVSPLDHYGSDHAMNNSDPAIIEHDNVAANSAKPPSDTKRNVPTILEWWNEKPAVELPKPAVELAKPAAKETNSLVVKLPKPAAETPPPSTSKVIRQPNKKPKSRGRSNGDKSSESIKALRAQAEDGDIEAALRLGWGIDRLTEIFNRSKAARGEEVQPGQAIDDWDLVARINQRQKNQADSQKKRQEKLRVLAEAGDMEAARKLKWGKRTMAKRFPSINTNEDANQSREVTEEIESGSRSPAEPFDFAKERGQMRSINDIVRRGIVNGMQPAASQHMAAPAPQYPISDPVGFDPERALQHEYDSIKEQIATAKEQVVLFEAHFETIKKELQEIQANKNKKKRKTTIKIEKDVPKTPIYHKKARKPRPSNFPIEPIEVSADGEMQAYRPGGPIVPVEQGVSGGMQVYRPHVPAF